MAEEKSWQISEPRPPLAWLVTSVTNEKPLQAAESPAQVCLRPIQCGGQFGDQFASFLGRFRTLQPISQVENECRVIVVPVSLQRIGVDPWSWFSE